MPDFAEYARSYLWGKTYPNNVWRAFKCATKSNDTKLKNMAIEALVALLAKDNLNVRSELQLIDASLRWAMMEAGRQGLPPGPESMRTALGSALSLLRFLTLKPSEFANLQSTTKLLTYSESLAVIFNINSPGVVSMPDNLSNSTEPRASQSTDLTYFDVFATSKLSCPSSASSTDENSDIFDVLTSRNVQITINSHGTWAGPDYPQITGIQFPTQTSCESNYYDENFTVSLESSSGQELYTKKFIERVACDSLIRVKFENAVQLTEDGEYKFKVTLHQSGRYPRWKSESTKEMPHRWNWNGINSCSWQFPDNSFMFSVITNCNSNYYNNYGRPGYVLA
ncbi:hypothetical protein B566_EDAN001437 [Ephemera danica]|nr:hypothetical protein B566_EDAN001437 [Ephemera danica]